MIEKIGPNPLAGPDVDGFSIGIWCPSPDGTGPAEAVAFALHVPGLGAVVLRMRSRKAVDNVILLLETYRDQAFGALVLDQVFGEEVEH